MYRIYSFSYCNAPRSSADWRRLALYHTHRLTGSFPESDVRGEAKQHLEREKSVWSVLVSITLLRSLNSIGSWASSADFEVSALQKRLA